MTSDPTPSPVATYRFRYEPALDGLRGLALLLVFFYHAQYGPALARGGHIGVDLFLVLSGFLITSILASEWRATGDFDLRRFYLRRVLRLAPAVVVCVALVACDDVRHGLYALADVPKYACAVAFYYVNMGRYISLPVPVGLNHLWSLSIEEQFYLLWPVLLRTMLRRSASFALRGTVALGVGLTLWEAWLCGHGSLPERLYLSLDTRANAVLLGAGLALWPFVVPEQQVRRWATGLSRAASASMVVLVLCMHCLGEGGHMPQWETLPAILAGGLLILVLVFGPSASFPGDRRWSTLRAVLSGLLAMVIARHCVGQGGDMDPVHPGPALLVGGLLILSLLVGPPVQVRSWFEHRFARRLGRLSYSAYLWHLPIILWINLAVTPRHSRLEDDLAAMLLTYTAASLSYNWVETPFLRLKSRFGSMSKT